MTIKEQIDEQRRKESVGYLEFILHGMLFLAMVYSGFRTFHLFTKSLKSEYGWIISIFCVALIEGAALVFHYIKAQTKDPKQRDWAGKVSWIAMAILILNVVLDHMTETNPKEIPQLLTAYAWFAVPTLPSLTAIATKIFHDKNPKYKKMTTETLAESIMSEKMTDAQLAAYDSTMVTKALEQHGHNISAVLASRIVQGMTGSGIPTKSFQQLPEQALQYQLPYWPQPHHITPYPMQGYPQIQGYPPMAYYPPPTQGYPPQITQPYNPYSGYNSYNCYNHYNSLQGQQPPANLSGFYAGQQPPAPKEEGKDSKSDTPKSANTGS